MGSDRKKNNMYSLTFYTQALNPLKTARGVAETRLTVEKLQRTITLVNNQSSMISIKYDHLQVMETITGKFHQNPLRNVGGLAKTRISVYKLARNDKGP